MSDEEVNNVLSGKRGRYSTAKAEDVNNIRDGSGDEMVICYDYIFFNTLKYNSYYFRVLSLTLIPAVTH